MSTSWASGHRCAVDLQGGFLGLADGADVLGKPAEALAAGPQDREGAVVQGADTVLEGFEVSIQGG